jgi:putative FmdB family regulatory protein
MPTYLYKCTECGHRFEHAQGFHDDPLEVCPDCGGLTRRVIGNVGVTFKGSGFYRTDSRADARKSPTKGTGTAKKDSGDTSAKPAADKKSESAPKPSPKPSASKPASD